MNIGIDIKAIKKGSPGISRYVRCILDELQRIDSENRYYLFECKKTDYAPVNPNWSKIPGNSKLPGSAWIQLSLPGLIKKYKIDVFWAPEQLCPVWGVPKRTKIVATVHDFVILRYPETCRKLELLMKRLLCPLTIRKSRGLVPVSDCIKKELLEFYPYLQSTTKIIRTVSNGVKDWNCAHQPAERENFLFFPGIMEPRKNLVRLVKALEIVSASGYEIDLHLCGPIGWGSSDLNKLMGTSPIRGRIKHLGYLSEADLTDQYVKCKALVFPSIYEGFGIPVLEALKLNTPVLTSRGTVMEEIAGENAMYFDPYDTESIAGAIIKFLKTGGAPVNQESLNRYTWRRAAENLLEVFTECHLGGKDG